MLDERRLGWIGECAALHWTDLVGDMLHVSRRIFCGAIDDLKPKGSRRKLPLAAEIANRLRGLPTTDQDSCKERQLEIKK